MLKKNDIIEAHIDDCTGEGVGVAHYDGQAIFVKGALPGEDCDIKIIKVGSSMCHGLLMAVKNAAAERVSPDCPYYPKCGGCVFRHVSYTGELEIKLRRVNDAFRRIGGLELRAEKIVGAESTGRYRGKTVLAVSRSADGKAVTGFFRQRSHDVIAVESCLLQSDFADAAAEVLRGWIDDFRVPPYDEATGSGTVRHLFVRAGMVCVVCFSRPRETDELVRRLREHCAGLRSVILNINRTRGNTVLSGSFETLWGCDTVDAEVCGLRFALSPMSFFQINLRQAERLYEKAMEYAALTGSESVIDLYCGAGSVGLVAAKNARSVIGVEIVESAVVNARENAARNGITNAEFVLADAGDAAADFVRRGLHPDVLFVDPPRKGLSPDAVRAAAEMSPQRIVYISCDPATLARDLKSFAALGYTAVRAEAVDMFPRTGHVETVCLLTREIKSHDMKLNPEPFRMIKSGKKTIELRLFDEKRQKIKVGDSIIFTETVTGEKLNVKVEKLHRFDSFGELYKSLPLLKCGYTEKTVADAKPSDMEEYYSAEEQKKYGVVGIEISRPDGDTDETVVLLSQQRPNDKIRVELDLTEFDITAGEKEATYQEINSYML